MADTKFAYATAAITLHSSLNSLATGSASLTAAVDNTTAKYIDALVRIKLVGSATTANQALVYAVGGFGDDVYTDELAPSTTGASVAVADLDNSPFLGAIQMETTSPYTSTAVFNVARGFGGRLPPKWAIVVRNESGAALAASGHAIDYVGIYLTTL